MPNSTHSEISSNFSSWLNKRTHPYIFIVCILLVFAATFIDYMSGPEIASSLLYLIPISIAAWYIGLRFGITIAVFSGILWTILDINVGERYSSLAFYYWNGLVRSVFFIIIAIVLASRRTSELALEQAKDKAEELAASLKQANSELQEAMTAKLRFTSMVSHELRTPLTAIKEGIGIVLDRSVGELNAEQRGFLGVVKRNVDRLHRLINEVLEFTKLEAGKVQLKLAQHFVHDLINDVIHSFESVALTQGIYLHKEYDPKVNIALCDADRITQVLTNLLNNAIKFTKAGGVTLRTKLREQDILISIHDTGVGIKQDSIPKLFRYFEQVGEDTYRKSGGTGLGLAICKEIVSGHGGSIWAESDGIHGTEIFFTLPLKKEKNTG